MPGKLCPAYGVVIVQETILHFTQKVFILLR